MKILRTNGFLSVWPAILVCLLPFPSLADTIYLKNGQQITGKVSLDDGKQVVYEIEGGEFTIPRSLVARIEKGLTATQEARPSEEASRAITAKDLPLPSSEASQPDPSTNPTALTADAIDPAKLQHLDNEILRNPTQENRRLLVLGYHDAATYKTQQGDPEGAIELYRHALKFVPDELAMTLSLSYLLIKQTHYNEAIRLLIPTEDEYPKSADVPLLLGSAYYSSESLDKAIDEWKKSLALQDNPALREALAKAEKEKTASSSYEEIQSVHFLLRYDGTQAKGMGEKILGVLETAFSDLQLDLGYYPSEPIVVLVYSRDAFRDVTRSPNWVGALNDGKIRVPVSGLTDMTPELARELKHELTHSFVHLITLDHCPVWFNEGLAQLEEGSTTATFGAPLARQLTDGPVPPLKELEPSFLKLTQQQVQPAYAKSLAALEYLRETYGMEEIRRLLKGMASNPDFNALLQQDLQMDYSSFEAAVTSYVAKKYGL